MFALYNFNLKQLIRELIIISCQAEFNPDFQSLPLQIILTLPIKLIHLVIQLFVKIGHNFATLSIISFSSFSKYLFMVYCVVFMSAE